ncbi:MAG: hypothetical protein AB8B87_11185 [Granulosicoccus sp.]
MKKCYHFDLVRSVYQCLNIALVGVIAIQIALYMNRWGDEQLFSISIELEENLYLISLFVLIGVACSRFIYHGRLARQAKSGREQLDAMISMFHGVKHKLNNDMQVVLGNAELAEILVSAGGNVARPVHNITSAANDAVDRIEQLSVFGSSGFANPVPVDLNAMLRESMARLFEELPPKVTLQLELDHLANRVMADRYLLCLSLTHLIRLAVLSMQHGGEIIVRTSEGDSRGVDVLRSVVARVYIVRARSQSDDVEVGTSGNTDAGKYPLKEAVDEFQDGLETTKALVERSGVSNVSLSRVGDESLLTMLFTTEIPASVAKDDLRVSQLYN